MSGPFQLFNPLDPATEEALRESIRRFGVLSPISTDGAGRILDGHHRARIAEELGVKCPKRTVYVGSDIDEAQEIARTLNADRRHLTAEQRREVAVHLREQGHSLRAIAKTAGVSLGQVQRDLAKAPVSPDTPAQVLGKDGKRYPATKPTPEPREVLAVDASTGEILPGPGLPDPVEESRPITSEQWQAENPDLGQMLAADPEVRAANLRHDLSRWMVELTKPYLFPAEEMAAIAADKADRIAELMDGMNQWHDTYRAALRRSRMTVVGGGQR